MLPDPPSRDVPESWDTDVTRLRKLQSVTDAALAHLSLDELLSELLTRIRDALDADTCAFLLLDERGEELVARAAIGLEEEVERGVRIPLGAGFAGRVVVEQRPIAIEDLDHADIFNPLLRERGLKSLLGAPLLARGRVLGVVHAGTLRPRRFTPQEVELMEHVAQRAALGLERALVHEELLRLDELRSNFVSVASHELRTPAAAIYGVSETFRARGDALSPEERRELFDALHAHSDRLRTLVDELLDLSRLDRSAVVIEPRPLRIRLRIEEAIALVAQGREADFDVRVDASFEPVIDGKVFERISANLLTNALRYGRPPITVEAGVRDGAYEFSVADSGEGVDPAFVPMLFERFTRSTSSADVVHGAGLGLAIVQAYARAHGGDVRYEDAWPHGARFVVTLPAPGSA